MKQLLILALLAYTVISQAQDYKILKNFDELEKEYFINNDTTYVFNFWATWCKPCVHELPFFDDYSKTIIDKKIKVILVSLDFEIQVEKHVIPYLEAKKLHPEVLILLDRKYNNWVSKVDNNWDGDIPATLLISGNKRMFVSHVFESSDELNEFVEKFISKNN